MSPISSNLVGELFEHGLADQLCKLNSAEHCPIMAFDTFYNSLNRDSLKSFRYVNVYKSDGPTLQLFVYGHADHSARAAQVDDLAFKILCTLLFYEILSVQHGLDAIFAAPVELEIINFDHFRLPILHCV